MSQWSFVWSVTLIMGATLGSIAIASLVVAWRERKRRQEIAELQARTIWMLTSWR
jgi:hypothetical protein